MSEHIMLEFRLPLASIVDWPVVGDAARDLHSRGLFRTFRLAAPTPTDSALTSLKFF